MYICTLVDSLTFTCRTIQSKEEDALKIIGKKAYSDLETKIFNLLGQQNFTVAARHKYSNHAHNDTVQKTGTVKLHELERSSVPPYRAQTYQDIIGKSPGGFELEYDSENEHDDDKVNPTDRWEQNEEGGEADELERELLREEGRMKRKWLFRDDKYRIPTQKLNHERQLLEERRLVLESFQARREERDGITVKQKKLKAKEEKDKAADKVKSKQKGSKETQVVKGGAQKSGGNSEALKFLLHEQYVLQKQDPDPEMALRTILREADEETSIQLKDLLRTAALSYSTEQETKELMASINKKITKDE